MRVNGEMNHCEACPKRLPIRWWYEGKSLGAITRTHVLHLSRRSGDTLLETASMVVIIVLGVASKLPLPVLLCGMVCDACG